MKNLFFIFILFMVVACNNNKSVYWCGDHPCINKKEKEAYFLKTMIVEIKDLKNKNYKSSTEYERILQQAKLEEKRRIREEKDLTKQIKLEDRRRIREEKELSRSKIVKSETKHLKKNIESATGIANTKIGLDKFSEIVEKITKKNTFRPFPDIDDIAN